MKTNLIIIEGLPGSGKSTIAARIAEKLEEQEEHILCVDEGAPKHPADFADYDFPDFKIERRNILNKWREFTEKADRNTVYVFNCVFMQNPICETMMRFGMPEAASQTYIAEISQIIKPLDPVILYIDHPDVKGAIDAVLDERGSGWLNAVIEYHTAQGYGKQNGLTGYEGYIKCLEERKARELRILQTLDIEHYIISRDQDLGSLLCQKAQSAPF